MYQGILFDLDGTLWDSTAQILPAWNRVLARRGAGHVLTLEEMKGYMGRTVEQIAALMLPHLPQEEGTSILKECCREEVISLQETGGILYPQLRETLEYLSESFMLAIVSNCQDGYIQAFLHAHGLGSLFADFESFGRTGCSKGENIKTVMERNHIGSAVYVGDTQGDWDAAKLAGVPFVHAAYGFGAISAGEPCPLAVISAFRELKPLLAPQG